MSGRLARNWSVQLKLSLLYQLLATAAFLAFAFILYQHFDRSLRSDFDAYLESKADGIEESIHTYWEAEGLKLPDPAAKGPPAGKRADSAEFERIARSWADDQGETPPFLMVAVRIFSPNGAVLAASRRIESGIGLSQETLNRASAGDSRFETIQIQGKSGARSSFRVYTRPVRFGTTIVYFIQVVSSLRRIESSLQNLMRTLFALVPAIILLTAIIIYYLTRSALMPIQRMIGTIRGVSDRDLLATLDIPDSGKELRDLAISFNSMMERVDESFKAQSRFFNDVAHQLKTPLAVLKGDLETTLNRVRSRDEYEQVLESNLEEVDRMVKLVNRMLVLARFDAGQVELKRERMSAREFLGSAEEEFRAMAEAFGCALAIDCRSDAELELDRDQTIRALAAIVENAMAHSARGETVEISADEADGQVRMTVRDHGPGIPEAELGRVFERFYRGSTARGDGFGIGLSMARSIARLEGGDIVAANAPGGGALITLRFPRAAGRETPQH